MALVCRTESRQCHTGSYPRQGGAWNTPHGILSGWDGSWDIPSGNLSSCDGSLLARAIPIWDAAFVWNESGSFHLVVGLSVDLSLAYAIRDLIWLGEISARVRRVPGGLLPCGFTRAEPILGSGVDRCWPWWDPTTFQLPRGFGHVAC